jgi:nucleotide-binding universal stress UspA family protein
MKTIVVGYDGTERGDIALVRAAEVAEAFGSTLIVVVVEEIVGGGLAAGMAQVPIDLAGGVDDAWQPDAQIAQARALLDERGVPYEVVTPIGNPAAKIIDVADQRAADLIVVGTSEPGFLKRLLVGSVSGSIARRAHCDVLVVH